MRFFYPFPAALFWLICFSTAVQAQYPNIYYTVKFPNDTTVFGCGASAPLMLPEITRLDACNINVGINKTDNVFYTNGCQNCYKIERRWRLVYWCDYNPNWRTPLLVTNPSHTDKGPVVVANSYNHGFMEYVQVIKVVDNENPVFVDCPQGPVVFCDLTANRSNQYNDGHKDRCEAPVNLTVKAIDACSKAKINFTYRLYLDLDDNGTMETFLSSSGINAFPVETTVSGDTLCGRIKFPANYELPYGRHKIEWIAGDYCAGSAICKYEFIIKDCKKPTAVCCNPISANLMQTGMLTLRDSNFLLYGFDNCTPPSMLRTGIRRSGTGSGFPTDHTVNFTCDEVGNQVVEVWVQDATGNADFCKAIVNIQDNMGSCAPPGSPTGTISTEFDKPLTGVQVRLLRTAAKDAFDVTERTDAAGRFASAVQPANCNFEVIPAFDTLASWGVTTADVQRLLAHIEAGDLIASPYSRLAGDVNQDRKLDMADVKLIEQMANGEITAFPQTAAWRFVPRSYAFMSDDPFVTAVPDRINAPCTPDYRQDFIAVKMGDVNGSVKNAPGGKPESGATERTKSTDALSIAVPTIHPNPTTGRIRVVIQMPEAGEVHFVATDLSGKTTMNYTQWLEAGFQEQWLEFAQTTGLQTLRIRTSTETVVRKVLVKGN